MLKRILAIFFLVFLAACKQEITNEQKQKVLLEELEVAKKIVGQSQYMTMDQTSRWIDDFTKAFKLDPEEVKKNSFKMNVVSAKVSPLATGNIFAITATWELTMLKDIPSEDGNVNRERTPAIRSVIYLWEPKKPETRAILDTGFFVAKKEAAPEDATQENAAAETADKKAQAK